MPNEDLLLDKKDAVSARLFFAKTAVSDTVWHICDAALGKEVRGNLLFMALHQSFIYPVIKADSVLQAELMRGMNDGICQLCLREYKLAVDTIKDRKMMRFD